MEQNEGRHAFIKEVAILALGELAVGALVTLLYFVLSLIFRESIIFDYTVITGSLLGAAVPVLNFLILSFAVSRAVDRYVEELRGRELSEEEAEKFALEHKAKINLAVTRSYIVRTLLMIGSLVLAFVSGWFDPIATVIPLLSYKPIMYLTQYIRRGGGRSK